MPNAMNAQEKLWWMIYALRASISLDWGKLAVEAFLSRRKGRLRIA